MKKSLPVVAIVLSGIVSLAALPYLDLPTTAMSRIAGMLRPERKTDLPKSVSAPSAVLLSWSTEGNLGTETSEPSNSNDPNLAPSNIVHGPGVTPFNNPNRFGGRSWWDTGDSLTTTLAESVAGNDYLEFTVTPNPGFSFTPTSFAFVWNASADTGPVSVTLRSSADGFATNLGSVTGLGNNFFLTNTITISGLENLTTATTFRIYGYGGTSSAGSGGFDRDAGINSGNNVVLNGTTQAAGAPEIGVAPASIAFGSQSLGTTSGTRSVTISNSGTSALNIGQLTKAGANPSDFSITQDPSNTSIAPAGTAKLQVTFTPGDTGNRSAEITIPSNDADEPSVVVNLAGTGTAAVTPDPVKSMWVWSTSPNAVTDAAARANLIARASANGITDIYLSVRDGGNLNDQGWSMYPTEDVAAVIAGAHAAGIKVWYTSGDPAWQGQACAPGNSSYTRMQEVVAFNNFVAANERFDGVMVDVEPGAAFNVGLYIGIHQCYRSILPAEVKLGTAINAFWEDPVEYPAGGETKPEFQHIIDNAPLDQIVVMGYRDNAGIPGGNGIIGLDEDEIAYASSLGRAGLIQAGLETQDGAEAPNVTFFEEGQTVMNTVMADVANHFSSSIGFGGFSIHAYGNEYLSGVTGWPGSSPAPEMSVENSNDEVIADGDTTPTISEETDFGSTDVSGGTVVRTFIIRNLGTAALDLTGTPLVSVSGTNAVEFTVNLLPSTPVAPAASTTFQVSFDPADEGVRTATISIANNDADEDPYNFDIQGTGTIPATPPAANDISPPAFPEDTESIVTLSYSDANGDPATACAIPTATNVTVTTACGCDASGVCTVGVTGTADSNGSASFTFNVAAAGQTSNDATATLSILAVNDAPVLDTGASPVLDTIVQDSPAPAGAVGTLVSALVDLAVPPGGLDNVTDPDSGALLGIAVTAADAANGNWFYTTNGGSNWFTLGSPSASSSRFLAADGSTRLYFQPNPGFHGTATITFRAWDRTAGFNGSTGSTLSNGGFTAFSTATDTASLEVRPPATIVVDVLTDTDGGALNSCTASPGDCSLRGANSIAEDGDTITFDPSLFDSLTEGVQPVLVLGGSEIVIANDLAIVGPGADKLTISGNNLSRVFYLDSATIRIEGLTITGGNDGGVFVRAGASTFVGVHIVGNTGTNGGGIGYVGGGGGPHLISRTTISGNNASGDGGGINISGGALSSVKMVDTTISGNSALAGGGIYVDAGGIELASTTITDNTAADGSGVYTGPIPGSSQVSNSIIAGNTDSATVPDVAGEFISGGFNLIGNAGTSSGFVEPTDQLGTSGAPIDPRLGPLQNNGGTTPTHGFDFSAGTSPAIDQGSAIESDTDQRGMTRPADIAGIPNAVGGNGSDIGAYELLAPTAALASIAGRVTDASGRPIRGAVVTVQDMNGGMRTFVTNTFGHYRIEGLSAGETYFVSVSARRYSFANGTQLVNLEDNVDGLDFTAQR